MGSIYRNATLVIAATDSPSVDFGFLYDRDPAHKVEVRGAVKGSVLSTYVRPWTGMSFPNIGPHDSTFESSTGYYPPPEGRGALKKRAWTFQERHLAARLIEFAQSELSWSCRSLDECECMRFSKTAQLPRDFTAQADFRESEYGKYTRLGRYISLENQLNGQPSIEVTSKQWMQLIESFTILEITNNKDRLPALAGIASFIRLEGSPSEYLCGLWKSDISKQICWSRPRAHQERGLPNGYAPTWSWACCDGVVSYTNLQNRTCIHEFLDCSIELVSLNPFGPGTGKLQLGGYLIPILLGEKEFDHYWDFHPRGQKLVTIDTHSPLTPKLQNATFNNKGLRNDGLENYDIPQYEISVQFRFECWRGRVYPDFNFSTQDCKTSALYFLLLEDISYSEKMISPRPGELRTVPRGLILERFDSGNEIYYHRVGWGDSMYRAPTIWWKSFGHWTTVEIR
jgi:hypothetical protein